MPTEKSTQLPPWTYSLAIETSSAIDSIAVGRGDELLETITLPQRKPGRSCNLMPAIAETFDRLALDRQLLKEIYVSVGPGSFTGLRIGIATAQMLAKVLDAKTVAVPTLDVVAQNAPAVGCSRGSGGSKVSLLVCLNQKRESVYCATFSHDGTGWHATQPPAVRIFSAALADAPRPVRLLSQTALVPGAGENGGEMGGLMAGVEVLPIELATPSAATVWRLGRTAARNGAYTDPSQLLPIYARIPEAVELWNKRHGSVNA